MVNIKVLLFLSATKTTRQDETVTVAGEQQIQTGEVIWRTIMNPIITLLLEEDVVLLPEPGVGQVTRVGLRLAGEEGILRDVHCNVLWW